MPARIIIAIVWSVINLFFFTANSFSIPADIQDISDNKYFQAVHEKLSGAKGSVYIAMYSISIEPDKTKSEPYILLQDLIDAHKRGIRVEVYKVFLSGLLYRERSFMIN